MLFRSPDALFSRAHFWPRLSPGFRSLSRAPAAARLSRREAPAVPPRGSSEGPARPALPARRVRVPRRCGARTLSEAGAGAAAARDSAEQRRGRGLGPHRRAPAGLLPGPGPATHTHKPQVHTHWDPGARRPWPASRTRAEPQPTQRRALHTPTNPQINECHARSPEPHSAHRAWSDGRVRSWDTPTNRHPANRHPDLLVHTGRPRGASELTLPLAVGTPRSVRRWGGSRLGLTGGHGHSHTHSRREFSSSAGTTLWGS